MASLVKLDSAEEEDERSAPGVEEEELFVSEGVGESDGEAEGEGDLEEDDPVGEWLRPFQ